MKKLLIGTFAAVFFALALPATAKDPEIAANSSGISDTKLINSAAGAAIGSGAKEPLTISGGGGQLIVSGSNGTNCKITVANGKIGGISCQ